MIIYYYIKGAMTMKKGKYSGIASSVQHFYANKIKYIK